MKHFYCANSIWYKISDNIKGNYNNIYSMYVGMLYYDWSLKT